ncbi:hypothetical protein RJ640_004856 [Escallonia rubra]|uniref:Cytidyltransferase-like domain-containing protein n=1 Tax=Escallonia rubra TaxID=112253 RepID=A0AA88U1X6_9ASTE|nr:hypothetical protein RJ640_004856 [Escallonia rubra]
MSFVLICFVAMLELARDALNSEGFLVIGGYMSPVNDAYKKKGLISAEHRGAMCQLACKSSEFIMVDHWETGEVVIVVAAITGDLLEDDGSGGGGIVEDGHLVHVLDDGAGLEDGRLEAVEVEAVGLLEVLELVSPLGGDDGGGTGAEAAVVDAGGGGGVVGEFDEEFGGGDGDGLELELFRRGAVGGGNGGGPESLGLLHIAKQSTYQRTLTVLSRIRSTLCDSGLVASESLKIVLVCGSDMLESFGAPGAWIPEQVRTICRDYGVVCIRREGQDIEKIISSHDILHEYKSNIKVVDELVPNRISSTLVRDCISRGLSVKYLTADEVIDYIKQHNLYLNSTG